ncbi:MAG: PhzF family phenazine biosynthesis protein, partial [Candidatus Thermoplasmatota archaeon]|nr:PhzF family phenazine biosynthesis protein [Candidatus Thermoplasmatota archaeon]
MKIQALKVNSFTSKGTGGNPAGVVLEPGELTAFQMKKISRILQVSETAYVFPSNLADFHVRFFSPAVEVDLCGHATIATFTVLAKKQNTKSKNVLILTQETKAGVLPVKLHFTNAGDLDYVLMQQQ